MNFLFLFFSICTSQMHKIVMFRQQQKMPQYFGDTPFEEYLKNEICKQTAVTNFHHTTIYLSYSLFKKSLIPQKYLNCFDFHLSNFDNTTNLSSFVKNSVDYQFKKLFLLVDLSNLNTFNKSNIISIFFN